MSRQAVENITDLTGRVAVVIGSTSGLGRTIALGLARAGADVVATGRREELVESIHDAIRKLGRRTLCQTVDVASRESIDLLRNAVVERFGQVDILVNAAGKTARTPTAEVSE